MAKEATFAARHPAAIGLLIFFTLAIFAQTIEYPYISMDDPYYVSHNPHILDHLNRDVLWWSVSDVVVSNWHPVTMLSHALIAAFFGLKAGPQHAANVILHGLNACLLYVFLWRCTRAYWPSLFAALVFAVHPLRVETVAWISDRKGVLCGFFVMLTLLSYERFVRERRYSWYACVLLSFAMALLSKPTAIALPFALLLLDYWPLARLDDTAASRFRLVGKLVLEKAPLIALSVAGAAITFLVQRRSGAVQDIDQYPLGERAANAVVSYVMYLTDTLVPFNLTPQYPHPGRGVFGPALYVSILVFVCVTLAAFMSWKRRPWVTVGWLWYCGMLVPAIGLVQVAHQARADRYTYLPQIGLLLAIAWTLDEVCRRIPSSARLVFAVASLWTVALAVAAFAQTILWSNDFTLFSYTVARAPNSSQARYILGTEYLRRGELKDAEEQFRASIEHTPLVPEAFNNLGVIESQRGDAAHAAEHFSKALSFNPLNVDWQVNYGGALFSLGRRDEAAALAERALKADPSHPRALQLQAACKAAVKGG